MQHIKINLNYLFEELAANYFSSAKTSGYAATLEWEEIAYTNLATAYEDFKSDEETLRSVCGSLSFDFDKVKILYRCFKEWRKRNERNFPLEAHYNKILNYLKGC